jgi:predicted aconitase
MKLTEEEEFILKGGQGKGLQRALNTLVRYGKAFGADRLVDIQSGHLAGSFGAFPYRTYYDILETLVSEGLQVKVKTTVNPRPIDEPGIFDRVVTRKQPFLEASLEKLGVTPNYSCVCYDKDNVPGVGDILGWAESSAVQFANSALGARTNRNSVAVDVCSAVLGKTPLFGYLLDENRRGQVLVKVDAKKIDFPALGYLLGQRVVGRVPVIEHIECTRDDLKNMGAAMAASGAVALFHVEGVTPEASDLNQIFDREPEEVMTITQSELDALRSFKNSRPEMVVFGCPHMTLKEVQEIGERFRGRKVKLPTYFCMIPRVKDEIRETGLYDDLKDAGVRVTSQCPVATWTIKAIGRKTILSNSAKLYYYLHKSEYGTTEDCLRFAGAA